jgi:hypothetical protein
MKDVVMVMDTTLGRPARILEALADHDVEVVAGCLFPRAEGRVAHVAVASEDAARVRDIAADNGAMVLDDRDVLVVDPTQHGSLAAIARKVADAGAVVQVAYFGAGGEIVLATSDLDIAREALGLPAS